LIIRSLRRAVTLDPAREKTWDLLTTTLASNQSLPQLKSVCEERVRRKPSARNLLMLTKSFDSLAQWDKASEAIALAVKKEPDNFACRVTQAALLLRSKSDEKSLDEAGRILARVGRMLEGSGGNLEPALAANFLMNASLYQALNGDRPAARKLAEQAVRLAPDDREIQEVLAAVSR
jgi:tetratricopeptide (TPR) repeat protein